MDNDGDGIFTPQDCNDNNPDIYPGAVEVCDGLDNNCNGQVDEGAPAVPMACNVPYSSVLPYLQQMAGMMFISLDQAVTLARANPQPFIDLISGQFSGQDLNCNGQPDTMELLGVCTATDFDNDGYPTIFDCDDNNLSINAGATEACGDSIDNNCDGVIDEGCTPIVDADGDGYGTAVDCNDTNSSVYPGAAELCDGLDNDSNNIIDDGCFAP